ARVSPADDVPVSSGPAGEMRMRAVAARRFMAAAMLGLCPGLAIAADPAVVTTDTGAVRGTVGDGVLEWKGIPYAKPPVGALRFSLPEPASAWSGTLDATRYGTICP